MEKNYNINLSAEYNLGLTARILLLLNKKQLNIRNLNVSEQSKCEYHYSIEVSGNENQVINTVKLLRKQIGVYKALFKHTETEVTPPVLNYSVNKNKMLLEVI